MVSILKQWKCFDGQQFVYTHDSAATGTPMNVAVYVPSHNEGEKLPVLIFLSGLTCTWENFTTKAGAQRYAAAHKVILVMPDTSPRGEGVPDDAAYDLGQGAGFYVDATEAPWKTNFQMYSYVTKDLHDLIAEVAPADMTKIGITGHSMGGHGALVIAFRNPEVYTSVSAIAPISSSTQSSWGPKLLTTYLGNNPAAWESYDATLLAKTTTWKKDILVDQGAADEFLEKNLRPDLLDNACRAAGIPISVRLHEGYDHSYYFISTVIEHHIAHHAKQLKA